MRECSTSSNSLAGQITAGSSTTVNAVAGTLNFTGAVTLGAEGQDVSIVLSQPHGGRSQTEGDALQTLVTQGSRDKWAWPARMTAWPL